MRFRKTFVSFAVAAMIASTAGWAVAEDIGDKQGWCKKQQGSSSCSGQSECSTRGREEAPKGQARKC
jgi:hypothetical protein